MVTTGYSPAASINSVVISLLIMPRAYPIFCENVKFKFGFSQKMLILIYRLQKGFLSVLQNRGSFGDR
jgi:hypothetical protein